MPSTFDASSRTFKALRGIGDAASAACFFRGKGSRGGLLPPKLSLLAECAALLPYLPSLQPLSLGLPACHVEIICGAGRYHPAPTLRVHRCLHRIWLRGIRGLDCPAPVATGPGLTMTRVSCFESNSDWARGKCPLCPAIKTVLYMYPSYRGTSVLISQKASLWLIQDGCFI